MERTMNNRLMTLDDGDLIELPDARGATLRVGRGTVWLTQERDPRDIVLNAGDAWTIERSGLTLAEARGSTSLLVTGTSANDASIRSHGATWRERLGDWLARVAARTTRRTPVPYY
jgi:hypothetical protein